MMILLVILVSSCSKKNDVNDSESSNKDDSGYEMSGDTVVNRDFFKWDILDKTKIVGYSEEGLKQTEIIIPAECSYVSGLSNNET